MLPLLIIKIKLGLNILFYSIRNDIVKVTKIVGFFHDDMIQGLIDMLSSYVGVVCTEQQNLYFSQQRNFFTLSTTWAKMLHALEIYIFLFLTFPRGLNGFQIIWNVIHLIVCSDGGKHFFRPHQKYLELFLLHKHFTQAYW